MPTSLTAATPMADNLKVEVGFDSLPTDEPQVWTDVTAYVRDVSTTRGRNQELENYQAGRCSITLSNADRRFDPTHLTGPYVDAGGVTQVLPMKRVRVVSTSPIYSGQALVSIDDTSPVTPMASTPYDATWDYVNGGMSLNVSVSVPNWDTLTSTTLVSKYATTAANNDWELTVSGTSVTFSWRQTDGTLRSASYSAPAGLGTTFGLPNNGRVAFSVYLSHNISGTSKTVHIGLTNQETSETYTLLNHVPVTVTQVTVRRADGPLQVGASLTSTEITLYYVDVDGSGPYISGAFFTDSATWTVGETTGDSAVSGGDTWTLGNGTITSLLVSDTTPIFEGFVDTWRQELSLIHI